MNEKTAWVETFAENDPCDTWEITDTAISVVLANNIEKPPKSILLPILDSKSSLFFQI